MLKEKLNLKTIFYLLNVLTILIFFVKASIQVIDVLYLFFVLLFSFKNIFIEIVR